MDPGEISASRLMAVLDLGHNVISKTYVYSESKFGYLPGFPRY